MHFCNDVKILMRHFILRNTNAWLLLISYNGEYDLIPLMLGLCHDRERQQILLF